MISKRERITQNKGDENENLRRNYGDPANRGGPQLGSGRSAEFRSGSDNLGQYDHP